MKLWDSHANYRISCVVRRHTRALSLDNSECREEALGRFGFTSEPNTSTALDRCVETTWQFKTGNSIAENVDPLDRMTRKHS
jgi:hypothetical protein